LHRRSIGDTPNSSRRLEFLKSLKCLSASIPLELPEVRELKVLSRDSELPAFRDAPIEVSVRSVVSELGIHLQSSGLLPVAVSWVTIRELSLIRRSIVSDQEVLPTKPCARMMLLKRL